jgi:hypothetical protein
MKERGNASNDEERAICHFSFEGRVAWLEIWNSNLEIAEGSAMKNDE